MPRETYPIDVPPSRPLIAAFIFIVVFGVLALAAHVRPRSGSVEGHSADAVATDTMAEFGD